MPSSSELKSFAIDNQTTITWTVLGILAGALGWEVLRRTVFKDPPIIIRHQYDGLTSQQRFERLVKTKEVPHY